MPAAIHFGLREDWRKLKRGRPGHRFQDRYEQARHDAAKCGIAKRIGLMIAAAVLIVVGLFFAVVPGPAVPFFFVAGALLASESRAIARAMDWIEVRVRKVLAWAKRRWRQLPVAARVAVCVVGVMCSATSAYLMYRFIYR
jgi:hypothetical protein